MRSLFTFLVVLWVRMSMCVVKSRLATTGRSSAATRLAPASFQGSYPESTWRGNTRSRKARSPPRPSSPAASSTLATWTARSTPSIWRPARKMEVQIRNQLFGLRRDP